MLDQIVKWMSLVIFLFVYFIAKKQVLAEDELRPPPPTAYANVSTVSAGSAFTIKCEMPKNYTIGKETFYMFFVHNISKVWFTYYYLPGKQQKLPVFSILTNGFSF